MRQLKHHDSLRDERGFTLPEVLIVIVIMGIVLAIASGSWFGLVENRRVESATNQMVSDLRLAHTRATNRLENWQLDVRPPGGTNTEYRIGPCADPCEAPLPNSLPSRSLEKGSVFPPGMSGAKVVFKPDGAAAFPPGNIQVAAVDGSPCNVININEATSRIGVIRNAC